VVSLSNHAFSAVPSSRARVKLGAWQQTQRGAIDFGIAGDHCLPLCVVPGRDASHFQAGNVSSADR
jgi:hypothetical protein